MARGHDLHVKVQAEPYAYWFIIVVVALFGALMLLAGFDRLSKVLDLEGAVKVLIGLAIFGGAYRAYRYFTMPNVSVTGEEFVYRPFWSRWRVWRFDETERFAAYTEIIPVRVATLRGLRNTGRTNTVEYLARKSTSGEVAKVVLPGFVTNAAVLEAISQKGGFRIDRLEGADMLDHWAAS